MYNFIKALNIIGFLKKTNIDNEEIYHLKTPCRFRIEEDIVSELKNNYCIDEEIGGILWAKPSIDTGENTFSVKKITFIRNIIEDTPRTDHRNKSNAYLPDNYLFHDEVQKIIFQGFLPIKFHSHPVKSSGFLQTLINTNFVSETSDQDVFESSFFYNFGNEKLLMPRCLIVGNDLSSKDIFIGLYNGFVAPTSFDESKKKVQEENLRKASDLISTINPTGGQKIGLAFGAALLLFVIAKYPKYSLPVVLGLTATIPQLLTNTQNHNNPHYFNKLSSGCADIFIPET
jgi:hypothetical protein